MMGEWGWGYGFGGVFMALWWVFVIAGIVALVKWLMGSTARRDRVADRDGPGKTGLEILKTRYARGEIGQEEFEQKRRDLEN